MTSSLGQSLLVWALILTAFAPHGSDSFFFRATRYPDCPLTGKQPVAQRNKGTRCVDASTLTCCSECTDIRQALGLVSANFSGFVRWLGLDPWDLMVMNGYLNGTDSNMCTIFAQDFSFAGISGGSCQDDIEQMACAMSCHPNSGNFIGRSEDGAYTLTLCNPFYRKVVDDCGALSLPKDLGQHVAQYIGYGPQIVNDVGNVAWGLSGLPEFHVTYSNATGPPGCYPGPPDLLPPSACCDPLSTTNCPAGVIDFKKHPEFKKFANDKQVDVLCRAGTDFNTSRNITNFSPPPLAPPPPKLASPPPLPEVISIASPPPSVTSASPPGNGALASLATTTALLQALLVLVCMLVA